MPIIFGLDYTTKSNHGKSVNHKCSKCGNETDWELVQISKYFTLFFIPVFPQSTRYWHECTICKNVEFLSREEFNVYKEIAYINTDFSNGNINLEEKEKQLIPALSVLNKMNIDKKNKAIEESREWLNTCISKTDAELLQILENINDYQASFIVAVEAEAKKRRLLA